MKGKWTYILIAVIFLAGLSLLLYPTVADFYNSYLQSQVIQDYSQQVEQMEDRVYQQQWAAADRYNAALLTRGNGFALTPELDAQYWDLLSATNQGIMAYVEIPSIGITLPIAHGTEESTLQKAVGHLEWSSLPVGGESTHCVLSGHRGLPSSELFTNIDHLEPGDLFYIHVLGQTLIYRVDNIATVEPHDYSLLGITQGKDYCTLVTCTPYGINSHRLLVRGIRVKASEDAHSTLAVKNEIESIDLIYLIPAALAILAGMVFLFTLTTGAKRKKKGGEGKYEKS